MQRKTKEEILIDNGIKYGVLNANGKQQMLKEMVQDGTGPEGISVIESMQEYADQEMEAFNNWLNKRYHVGGYSSDGALYYSKEDDIGLVWKERTFLTVKKLIALYKKEGHSKSS